MQFAISQFFVWIVTFLSYAAMYTTKSAYSYNKQSLITDMELTQDYIGTMDMFFLIALAFANYVIFGDFTKKIDIIYILNFGIILSSICTLSIPIMFYLDIQEPILILFSMITKGFFSATLWPSLVTIMGNWFSKEKRGLLMGFWCCSSNFGTIIGMQICHMVQYTFKQPWEYSFIITGFLFYTIALNNLLFLKSSPEEAGYKKTIQQEEKQLENNNNNRILKEDENKNDKQSVQPQQQQQPQTQKQNQIELNIFSVWQIPGVLPYTISYACLKSTSYGLLFWLPLYMNQINLAYYSASVSQTLQIGAIIGGIVTGMLSDYVGKRAIVMMPMIFLASIFMLCFKILGEQDIIYYYIFILGIGICSIGPYNIIGSAIGIDLSEQPQVKKNKKSIARISSIIEGTTAFSAAAAQRLIPEVGSNNIFYLFFGLCFISGLCILPMFLNEFNDLQKQRSKDKKNI